MMEQIYTFNGKDITMTMCIVIRDIITMIEEKLEIDFTEAFSLFYRSNTYKTLRNTENALWAEPVGYIVDRFFEEMNQT